MIKFLSVADLISITNAIFGILAILVLLISNNVISYELGLRIAFSFILLSLLADGLDGLKILRSGYDADGDNLTDWEESNLYSTNPYEEDSDADGLVDGAEVFTYLTDPNDSDTDDDTLDDGDEVTLYFTNPLVSDIGLDSDLDGLTNVEEVDTYSTNPLNSDTDSDGLDDLEELTSGTDGHITDPLDADSITRLAPPESPVVVQEEVRDYRRLDGNRGCKELVDPEPQ